MPVTTISDGDGCFFRNNPSIIALTDGYGRLCYRGKDAYPGSSYHTMFRGTNSNSYLSALGQYVETANLNSSDDNAYYAIAWSESGGTHTYFIDNTLRNAKEIGISGKYIQVSTD